MSYNPDRDDRGSVTGYAAIKYTAITLITAGVLAFGVFLVDRIITCH